MSEHLFEQLRKRLKADFGFFMLANGDGTELKGVSAFGPGIDPKEFAHERNSLEEYSPVVAAFRNKEPELVDDFTKVEKISERFREKYRKVRANWVVPLMLEDRSIGVLAVGYTVPKLPDSKEKRILQYLGSEASLAVNRALATEESREKEGLFRAVFGGVQDAIAIIDLQSGRFVKTNPAYSEMFGYTEEDLKLRTYRDITHPNSLDVSQSLYDTLLRENRSEFYQIEKMYIRKDGTSVKGRLRVTLPTGVESPQFFVSIVKSLEQSSQEPTLIQIEEELRPSEPDTPIAGYVSLSNI